MSYPGFVPEETADALLLYRALSGPEAAPVLGWQFDSELVDATRQNAAAWLYHVLDNRPLPVVNSAETATVLTYEADDLPTGEFAAVVTDEPEEPEELSLEESDIDARVVTRKPELFDVQESKVVTTALHAMALCSRRKGAWREVFDFMSRNAPSRRIRAAYGLALTVAVGLGRVRS